MGRRLKALIAALILPWAAADAAAQEAAARFDLRVEQANLSFDELQRLVPALATIDLPEDLVIEQLTATGPLDELTLDFLFRSSESRIAGQVTGNFEGPVRTARGSMEVESLNLVELLARPSLPTELTAKTTFDLRIDTAPEVPSITGDYTLNVARVELDDYAASDISAGGRFDRQALIIEDMSARVFGGRVTAEGRLGLPLGGRELTYDVSGGVARLNLAALPNTLPIPDVNGRLSLSYSVRDQGRGPTGRARLRETRLTGATIADGTTVTFDMTGPEVAYSASGRVSGLDPQAVGKLFEIEALTDGRFAGEVNATFSAEGRGANVAPLKVTLTESRLFGGTIPELNATVTRTAESIDVVAAGRFEGLQPHLAADSIPDGSLTGSLDVKATLDQTNDTFDWRQTVADGSIVLAASRIGDITIDRMSLVAQAANQVVDLRELAVQGPTLTANASGTIALDGVTPTQATYEFASPNVASLASLVGQEISGDVRMRGEVTGTAPLRVVGTIAASSVAYAGTEATTVNVTHDVLVPPDAPPDATADAQVEATFVRVAGRTLTGVTVDAAYEARALTFEAQVQEAERTIQSGGRLVLLPEGQEVHLTSFRFEAPGTRWDMPAGQQARIDYGLERIVVEGLRLETVDGQAITAEGVLGRTTAEGPLSVAVQGLNLQDLDALVFGGRGVAGTLTLDAALSGPLDRLGVDATMEVVNGGVGSYKFERLDTSVTSDDSAFQLKARLQQDPAAWLNAEGVVPRVLVGGEPQPGDEMDIAVTSSPIGLGFVGGFTDAVQNVQGALQADVRVTGTPTAPEFDGRATVTGGAFEIAELGTLYTGLDTTITFEAGELVIQEFDLLDENDQRMRVAGRLPYSGGGTGEVAVDITTDNFEVLDNRMGDIQVSTQLRLTGTVVEPRIEGTVRVTDGTLQVDEIMDLRGDNLYRAEPLDAAAADAALEADAEPAAGMLADAPLALAIALEMPALVIAGRDLQGPGSTPIGLGNVNLTVAGDLRLEKELEGPLLITGDVSTVRGTYELQGRRFEIERDGYVRFAGLEELNPLLDITATRLISGVQAQVRITGTLQKPELALSSLPPLDEADILSLIIFNQPANALGTAEQVTLGQRAANLASGFVASQLAESIGGALELDILEIDTGGSVGSTAGVTVGEQIGERLFLRVRQGFGSAGATQLMIEYEFTDWLRLQSTVSDDRGGSESLFQRSERSGVNWIFLFSY